MGQVLYTDDATTILTSAVLAGADSIGVGHPERFPTIEEGTGDYFFVTMVRLTDLAKEIVRVNAQAGSVFYMDRAQGDNDVPLEFSAGDIVELRWCAPAARALIADIAVGPEGPAGPSGTIAPFTETGYNPTFLTTSSFKVEGDRTSQFYAGQRLRCRLAPSTYVYGTVDTATFAAGFTTVTLRGQSANLTVVLDRIATGLADVGRAMDHFSMADSVAAVVSAAGVLTLDLARSWAFSVTLTQNITTVDFQNAPAGILVPIFLEINTGAGGFTVGGWDAAVKWPGGSVPTITVGAGKVDVIRGYTRDGGTNIRLFREQANS